MPGAVIWVDLDPSVGREQAGRRPAVVVSSALHLEVVTTLVAVVPVTTVDRGWSNHVQVEGATGLAVDSYAMTEQVRTIARDRIAAVSGAVDASTLAAVRWWMRDFLDE